MEKLQGVRFFRDSAGQPMIGLRGQPIPLRADVDDALGESICAHIRLCFDLTFEEGEHAKAAHLRKVLGVQP